MEKLCSSICDGGSYAGVTGCGVSHKSPESVTESLIEAYVDGKEKKVKDCYGQKKDTESGLKAEIDATIAYFKAHNVKTGNQRV